MSLVNPIDKSVVEYKINGKKYSLLSDPHTHTVYSHGTGTVRDNVLAARELGIGRIGIADHGPGHIGFGVPRKKLREEKEEILALREEFPEMIIFFSVEANILGDGKLDIRPEEFDFFDYICAGWHYGAVLGLTAGGLLATAGNFMRSTVASATARQIRRNTDAIVRALDENPIRILTHPGDKAPVDLLEIAVACARTNTLVEINTNHMTLTAADLRMMTLADVRFIISSDAHSPDRIGDFLPAVRLVLDAGIDPARVVNLQVE